MITAFGIINKDGVHIDTSKTLLGAKQYATRNEYKKVSKRTGYNARIVEVKTSLGWIKQENLLYKEWLKNNTK